MKEADMEWKNRLKQLLLRCFGNSKGCQLWETYQNCFPQEYQALLPASYALRDILQIKQITIGNTQTVDLFAPRQQALNYRLHFYSDTERYLDAYIPINASMGFRLIDQVQFIIQIPHKTIYIKSFAIELKLQNKLNFNQVKPLVLAAIQAILDKKLETDALNSLVVTTAMSWQEVDLLRAYRNYFLQLGLQSAVASFQRTLIKNPEVTKNLFAYFDARFRPELQWSEMSVREEEGLYPARLALLQTLENVNDINDDRILRILFNLIDATVRCNYFVRKPLDDYFIAFKINSLGVIDMPTPRPKYEIYVHAYDMEGLHLRGGKISRGGIRWSDRADDFRTEILGLMQTQMSKNALIIPTGAKGGFIVKQTYSDRNEFLKAGQQAYIRLMRGMLDLTDNYVKAEVVRLPGLVTYDGDDPYLVVAADKGTASFPDIANTVAADYQFWLKAAYASGGSEGYNHKTLGITARGAWESVKRHFRELGKDIQTQPFTVLGIGSMDGDVFGNGMLLSSCTRLLAAISGQHIFIDPDPDPDVSYLERKRLFNLARSSWADYDPGLISEGGGVYLRSAKDIPVTPALKQWLGIRYRSLDGESLVSFLLTAPVELLWLGGIGTYVKASEEDHVHVGDHVNDRVRKDALSIGAQVVGEGANLGFTQKARIEYSLNGGLINTDAIDNSAGVDISDHEVNLKILLADFQSMGLVEQPQELFNSLCDEVCDSVLYNNYQQSLCLSLDTLRCSEQMEHFLAVADRLESSGLLDPVIESFPSKKKVLRRQVPVLTRPELAVLLAASKLYLKQMLLEQDALIKADYCDYYLAAYFPEPLSANYLQQLKAHPLADNIKATSVSNYVLNQLGCSLLNPELGLENGRVVSFISCYLAFDRVIQADQLRQSIYALDNRIDSHEQYQLLINLENVLSGFCCWALDNNITIIPDKKTIECYSHFLAEYESYLFDHVDFSLQLKELQDKGLQEALANQILLINQLENFPLMVQLAQSMQHSFGSVLFLYNAVVEYFNLLKIKTKLSGLMLTDPWYCSVLNLIKQDLNHFCIQMVRELIDRENQSCVAYFSNPQGLIQMKQYRQLEQEVFNDKTGGLCAYVVLTRELSRLLIR